MTMDQSLDHVLSERWARPQSSFESYRKTVAECVAGFSKDNAVTEIIDRGDFTLKLYHSLLKSIFHQVYFSSTSFGMAGAMASQISVPVRTYLLHHAEEEMNHWIWILEDLRNTGYAGADPRSEHSNWAAQAYLSYGVFLSMFNPIGRLAMAQVLEGVSGTFGSSYGMKCLMKLKLPKEHAKFFLVHGELDQGHSAEIEDVLGQCKLSPEQWSEMEHVARTTAQLYKNIYNYSVANA